MSISIGISSHRDQGLRSCVGLWMDEAGQPLDPMGKFTTTEVVVEKIHSYWPEKSGRERHLQHSKNLWIGFKNLGWSTV